MLNLSSHLQRIFFRDSPWGNFCANLFLSFPTMHDSPRGCETVFISNICRFYSYLFTLGSDKSIRVKTNNARKKNKSNKTSVVFNEASRKDFLTGFRKRKNERRKKAKDQLEKEYKEEVRRAKQKAKDDVIHSKATGASHQILPEVEHLIRGIGFLKNKININESDILPGVILPGSYRQL